MTAADDEGPRRGRERPVGGRLRHDVGDRDEPGPGAPYDGDAVRAHVLIKLAARTAPVRFEALLLERGAVRVAWAVTGDFDYEIRLTCASLRDLTAELRALRDCGAEQTTTFLLLHEIVTDASRG